jgi:hypothetical protein
MGRRLATTKDPGDRANGPGAWPNWIGVRHAQHYREAVPVMATATGRARDPRRFYLTRDNTRSAEGCVFTDKSVALRGRADLSPYLWYMTFGAFAANHLKDGLEIEWLDEPDPPRRGRPRAVPQPPTQPPAPRVDPGTTWRDPGSGPG